MCRHLDKMNNDVSSESSDDPHIDLLNGEILLNTNSSCYLSLIDSRLAGKLTLTNYRFYFKSVPILLDVPLGFILKIDKLYSSINTVSECVGIVIVCKNGRRFQLYKYENDTNFELLIYNQLIKYTFYLTSNLECFAYLHRPKLTDLGWFVYDAKSEYDRMGLGDKWRITNINENFSLCETYPKYLCVPSFISDKELEIIGQFRSKNRLPVLSWISATKNYAPLMRSSQPLCGISGKRSVYDEAYLRNISQMTQSKGVIFDARPYLNALANCTNGGGYENEKYYESFKLEFLRIENIHTMRDCLGGAVNFNLDSKWLEHLKLILDGAVKINEKINANHVVLVHCSDGWDRTPQLTSLAMILMDSYYRTLEGFEVLIEKEWISFGHKFSTRVGHGCDKYFDQDRSPIFVQFVDCVWQCMNQNEVFFEFNEQLLHDILHSLYSNQYGTFLMDCDFEREKNQIRSKTVSFWSYVNTNKDKYINQNFIVYDGDLKIETDKLKLWESYFYKDLDKRLPKMDSELNRQDYDPIGSLMGTLKNNQSSFNNLFASGLRLFNTMLDKN